MIVPYLIEFATRQILQPEATDKDWLMWQVIKTFVHYHKSVTQWHCPTSKDTAHLHLIFNNCMLPIIPRVPIEQKINWTSMSKRRSEAENPEVPVPCNTQLLILKSISHKSVMWFASSSAIEQVQFQVKQVQTTKSMKPAGKVFAPLPNSGPPSVAMAHTTSKNTLQLPISALWTVLCRHMARARQKEDTTTYRFPFQMSTLKYTGRAFVVTVPEFWNSLPNGEVPST